jgi:hypothetical protein
MQFAFTIFLLTVNFVMAGCATAVSPPREAYILARDHGWIDITVSDSAVPAAPFSTDEKEYVIRPPVCTVELLLNGERFLSEGVYPVGDQPPYRLESGFRFVAPVGQLALQIEYHGCDVGKDGKAGSVSITTPIEVRKNLVAPIIFDGSSLFVEGLRENEAVTLEKLDDRLNKIERLIRTK